MGFNCVIISLQGKTNQKELEMKKTDFITTLNEEMQNEIKNELVSIGLCEEDLYAAMNSRICDLEDTINIEKYL